MHVYIYVEHLWHKVEPPSVVIFRTGAVMDCEELGA